MNFKVKNVNVAFEQLLEAAEAYTGFVMGLKDGDVVSQILGKDKDLKATAEARKSRKVFAKMLDRTVAGLSLSDFNSVIENVFKGTSAQDYLSIVHQNSVAHQLPTTIPANTADRGQFNDKPMTSMLKFQDPKGISREKIKVTNPAAGSSAERDPDAPDQYTVSIDSSGDLSKTNTFLNRNTKSDALDRFENPSFGTVTIKRPEFSFTARQASHLPVFLSAVTPLEMSRCTPYLDVKIVTPRLGSTSKNKANRLGIYNFLRQDLSSDSTAFGGPGVAGPVPDDMTESADPGVSNYYNYMDLFTSPQTMVNANINKRGVGQTLGSFDYKNDDLEDLVGELYDDADFPNVRDPFQPLMTLISFNVSVTGVGHGLLSTKRAVLKVKLHDRSRIRDLHAVLSPDEFAFTKFVIEYGWSHPEGDLSSTNTIGRYLNALRDGGVYSLTKADYQFGTDNSVDITLSLVCSGFQEMKSISAAGGVDANLNVFFGSLTRIINQIAHNKVKDGKGGSKSQSPPLRKDIRGKVKIANRNLKSKSALIPFVSNTTMYVGGSPIVVEGPSLGIIRDSLLKLPEDYKSSDKILDQILGLLVKTEKENPTFEDLTAASAAWNSIADAAGDTIYSKLYSLDKTVDPYVTHVSSNFYPKVLEACGNAESDEQKTKIRQIKNLVGLDSYESCGEEHITLGKILSMFVGYPMSTCGLYDEVQMFFYPVNNQSAGARKHTTASFPISYERLKKEVDKRMLANEASLNNLSVHGFFSLVDRIVGDRTIPAYGVYTNGVLSDSVTGTELKDFEKKSPEDKISAANAAEAEYDTATANELAEALASIDTDDADLRQSIENNKKINVYRASLRRKISEATVARLGAVYNADKDAGVLGHFDDTSLSTVNLSMFFETVNLSATPESAEPADFFKNLIGLKRRETTNNGVYSDKTILRIHIYDQNAQTHPDLTIFGTDAFVSGKAENTDITEALGRRSYPYFKNLLMNNHPTIIHGASTGVVNNVSVQSNTNGALANTLIVEAYDRNVSGGSADSNVNDFDETILFPTTVTLDIMGFPTLSRGCQLFVDFGTQTSLDNLYRVVTVDHSVSAGNFSTQATLVASNQFAVTSFRDRMLKNVARIKNPTETEG